MKPLYDYRKLLLLIFLLALYGFSTSSYDTPVSDSSLPKGDPDPNKGIYLRYDSTAEDVLAESSSSIKLGVHKAYTKPNRIVGIQTLMLDRAPKKLILLGRDVTTILNDIYSFDLSFFNHTPPYYWSSCHFRLFPVATFHNPESLAARLKEFSTTLEAAGWERDQSHDWNNFSLPTNDTIGTPYARFTINDLSIGISVKMRNPKFNMSKDHSALYFPIVSLRHIGGINAKY